MNLPELKPCPFCGDKARSFLISSCDCCGSKSGVVNCWTCPAEVSHCETQAEAIAAWNTRTDQLVERAGVVDDRFEAAYREYSDKLGWLQGNRNLPVCYLGWHVADAATDMLKRAYPELALAANGSATDAD